MILDALERYRKGRYFNPGIAFMFQNDNMGVEQRIVIDTLVKTSNVLSTLINDVMDISAEDNTGRCPFVYAP